MTVNMKICAEGHVLFFTYSDDVTIEEIEDFYTANRKHRDYVKYTVHTLLDVRMMRNIPFGALRTRSGPGFTHPRSGQIVLIGANHVAKSLVTLAARFGGNENKLQFFNTLDEGWEYLRKLISAEHQSIDVGCA